MDKVELTSFQQKVVELVDKTAAPGKHAARSAIRHIHKAWKLREIDREMAAFRGITGEEESATAIFHALVRRKYDGAKNINRWKHSHKWAVAPFFRAVADVLSRIQKELKPGLEISEVGGVERIRVRVKITQNGVKGRGYPIPPLNFTMEINGKVPDYAAELEAIAKGKQFADIKRYVDDLANLRNRILYASQQGIPEIAHSVEKNLRSRRDKIFANLIVFLMIDPYPERQLFVQQSLWAFLNMMELLPADSDRR